MRIASYQTRPARRGSVMIGYFIVMVVTVSTIAGLAAFVAQSTNLAHRRNDMIAAIQYAEGGAVIGCGDLNVAISNRTGTLSAKLQNKGYAMNDSLSTSSQLVFERTMTGVPFTNQTVTAQIWLTNAPTPTTAKVVATATTGKVTHKTTVNVKLAWVYPAAIISINPGSTDSGMSASTAKKGNVVVNGDRSGPIIVDGGVGLAILANGRANIDNNYAHIPASAISQTNFNTANEIPDYTTQGNENALFDFNRFIAVADATPNTLNTNSGNNHFTNLLTFLIANKKAVETTPAKALEGVIVVDIIETSSVGINVLADPDRYPQYLPGTNGINVRGTLFFNFGPRWGALDKVFNRVPMNINAANLAGLVATNPATYPSGYPPVYTDPTKNPANINIYPRFENFTAQDDLPAVMYSIGTVDMHGPVNISGVVYTPSYMEIENRPNETGFAKQLQYFKGSLIMGLGIYYENIQPATSIISFDPRTLDSLSTLATAGKQLVVAYWE